MLCKNCGAYADDEAIVCPECGKLLHFSALSAEGGAEAIRQGKRAREAVTRPAAKPQDDFRRKRRSGPSHATVPIPAIHDTRPDPNEYYESFVDEEEGETAREEAQEGQDTFDRGYRPVYSDEASSREAAELYASVRPMKQHRGPMVNWFRVALIVTICVGMTVAGGWLFLKKTEMGQRVMARLGREATSTALWKVGEEKLDSGDIEGAILHFEKAKAQDEENQTPDVDGLLLLGSAYEAAGMTDEAAALYEEIFTETPNRPEAYVNLIRILLARRAKGDLARAGELMQEAYEKTGEVAFLNQRNDFVPAPPKVDLTAALYDTKKYISITSYQGFDVYYTFDENADLPEGGTLFTERVFLDEGVHTLRAVAVDGELVSDELRGTYKIIMPSPQTPRSSLAPNTYKQRQRVRLKPGLDNENDTDIVIYYTIDGSNPDADSPIYNTDEPFWLPGGRVTLKAVAVNKYNKVSNMLEIMYKIEAKPYPLSACTLEEMSEYFSLYVTTMTDFQQTYGPGDLVGDVRLEGLDTDCRRYDYSWGYAVMSRTKSGWVLAEVYCDKTGPIGAPRGTKVGDSADYVVGKFRDMGQVASKSGNRGLYSVDGGTGKIWAQEDGGKIIRYTCVTKESHRWQFDYIADPDGIVTVIDMRYYP